MMLCWKNKVACVLSVGLLSMAEIQSQVIFKLTIVMRVAKFVVCYVPNETVDLVCLAILLKQ